MLLVPMPAELSHTGQFRWAIKGVDSCIADLVQALNNAGVYTSNSCCGHGKTEGVIALHDGRELTINSAHSSVTVGCPATTLERQSNNSQIS
jgi:hypothetical protein